MEIKTIKMQKCSKNKLILKNCLRIKEAQRIKSNDLLKLQNPKTKKVREKLSQSRGDIHVHSDMFYHINANHFYFLP